MKEFLDRLEGWLFVGTVLPPALFVWGYLGFVHPGFWMIPMLGFFGMGTCSFLKGEFK